MIKPLRKITDNQLIKFSVKEPIEILVNLQLSVEQQAICVGEFSRDAAKIVFSNMLKSTLSSEHIINIVMIPVHSGEAIHVYAPEGDSAYTFHYSNAQEYYSEKHSYE